MRCTGPIIFLILALLLPACSTPIIEGELLSLEPARAPKSAATLQELLPWATDKKLKPSPIEAEPTEGEFVTAYEVLEGDRTGRVLLQTRRAGEAPGQWTISRRIDGEDRPLEERFQTIDPADGSLVLPYSLNHERGVRVEMDPAPITVPARIAPNETITREMKIRLPLIENPKRLREKGTAISEFTYLGDQRVHTAAGTFDARHLREVFTSRFSSASAVRTIDRWYAPQIGLVAERWNEEVSVLGIVIERSNLAIRILPPGPPKTSSRPAWTSDVEPLGMGPSGP